MDYDPSIKQVALQDHDYKREVQYSIARCPKRVGGTEHRLTNQRGLSGIGESTLRGNEDSSPLGC
jgi:hypothetical protein